ncbi:MAG: molybdopterin-guanine dinucleotide biosynthesis protein [Flavipsychrobacter sp.]|jgi:molybdopterin-guanine dinucleotide biosynthesis protein A|nr:molybdopterin-guanine dinucleotide biosynthesis protein [Flavipsychrobacter sp.]
MSKLYGLVVCGGKSSRMGTDKSLLNYHGKPQRYHLYDLMKPFCERVFISCNTSQAPDIPSEYEALVDDPEYGEIGPMAALLTAFKHHPQASFMVIGCDYPYISASHLKQLFKAILEVKCAVAYYCSENCLYEPLLAGYHSNMKLLLENNFRLNSLSLQRVLKELPAGIITPDNDMVIRSIDTVEEYEKVVMQLCISKNFNSK